MHTGGIGSMLRVVRDVVGAMSLAPLDLGGVSGRVLLGLQAGDCFGAQVQPTRADGHRARVAKSRALERQPQD